MKKTILETTQIFIASIVISVAIDIITGVSLWGLCYGALDMAVKAAIIMLIGNVVFKLNRYRSLLGHWEYWVGFGLLLLAVFGLAYAKNSETWTQFLAGLAVLAVSATAAGIWDWKKYNIYTLNPNEYETEVWRRAVKKFLKADEDAIKEGMSEILRFHFIADNVESGLDFDNPFVEGVGYSLSEMKEHKEISPAIVTSTEAVINNYVKQIVALKEKAKAEAEAKKSERTKEKK
ncbi:MAG: hypothetical protein IJ831_03455 [Spirochaetales bacterium]|nr:hypothetical protein [Spirochaetales bacterium]